MDKTLKGLFEQIANINPYEFSLLATIIGLLIDPKIPPLKKQAIGNFIMLIAQTIVTLSSKEQADNYNRNYNDINILKELVRNNINNIDEIIDYIKSL